MSKIGDEIINGLKDFLNDLRANKNRIDPNKYKIRDIFSDENGNITIKDYGDISHTERSDDEDRFI